MNQYRCRIYNIAEPSREFPNGEFTVVWDSFARPVTHDSEPSGQLVATLIDEDEQTLKIAARKELRKLKVKAPSVWVNSFLLDAEMEQFTKQLVA